MQKHTKAWSALIVLYSYLFVFPAISFGQPKEIMKFGVGDTLEELKTKIEHNGYNFTVDNNWVYDMPPEMKESFLSRHSPLFPRDVDVSEDIGPLARHLEQKLALPTQFDWRDHNGHSYIGPVRNQGYCGSCYAFAACAAAEGTYNRAMDKYDESCADFSESYIMWCLGREPDYYSHFFGCDGADWDYVELDALTVEGIASEDDFPYTTSDPDSCTHWEDPTVRFNSWHRVPCNNIDAIKTAIMLYGVVDAAVYVGSAFTAYSEGIYEDSRTSCDASPCYYTYTNHAVALVGWNDNGDQENGGYWILRNSWGSAWGESGYMRLKYQAAYVACEATYLAYHALPAPSGLGATALSASQINLSWTDNSSDELGFEIESKTGSRGTYAQIATADPDVTSYSDTDLGEATTYYYRLCAYSAAGNSNYSNETGGTTYPAAPSGLSAAAVSSSQINVSWTDNSSGESGFKVERKTGSGGTYSQVATVSNVTSYSDTDLGEATTYYYRLRAYSAAGNSNYSNETGGTTYPATPYSNEATSSAGGGGGSSCFIATSAYGYPLALVVMMLHMMGVTVVVTLRKIRLRGRS